MYMSYHHHKHEHWVCTTRLVCATEAYPGGGPGYFLLCHGDQRVLRVRETFGGVDSSTNP
ncbi:hypothetical protein M3J09_012402 [Ascochyta lentis]